MLFTSSFRGMQSGLLFLLVLAVIYVCTEYRSRILPATSLKQLLHFSSDTYSGTDYPESARELWKFLEPLIRDNDPAVVPLQVDEDAQSPWYRAMEEVKFQNKTKISPKEVEKMRETHAAFVAGLKETIPSYTPGTPPTQGIVTVSWGTYFPPFLVSLRMLRATGSKLPVEVFIPSMDEYEPEICEKVLPTMNAKCLVLTDAYEDADIFKYQYKIFSILFSSFDDVLFLDSDAFPVQNPDKILVSEPFTSHGLVTWPDLWAQSVSPIYFDITGRKPFSLSSRASTESGQLLVSKSLHHHSLALVAYYNYYGPSHYYLLLSQGPFGRSDRDTFLPAAEALSLPYYQVHQHVLRVGHAKKDPAIFTYGLIQYDPVADFVRASQGASEPPSPMFMHTNAPKWNPLHMFDDARKSPKGRHAHELTRDHNGDPAAAVQVLKESADAIPGVERMLWDQARWVACSLEHKFVQWGKETDICIKMNNYFAMVLEMHPGGNSRPKKAAGRPDVKKATKAQREVS